MMADEAWPNISSAGSWFGRGSWGPPARNFGTGGARAQADDPGGQADRGGRGRWAASSTSAAMPTTPGQLDQGHADPGPRRPDRSGPPAELGRVDHRGGRRAPGSTRARPTRAPGRARPVRREPRRPRATRPGPARPPRRGDTSDSRSGLWLENWAGHLAGDVIGDDRVSQAERRLVMQRFAVIPALRGPGARFQSVDQVRLAPVPAQRAQWIIPATDRFRV
jgi:hypothetical protein